MLLKKFPDRATFISLAAECNVIPLCAEVLADIETPVSVLRKFRSAPGGESTPLFLLESVEGGDRWGRFTFLGVGARAEVEVYREHVRINAECIPHAGRPLDVLREYMRGFRAAQLPELPRFFGGLTGYFAYEMVSFLEDIPNHLPEDVPLAHLMLPQQVVIFDNLRQSMTCVQLVFLEDGEDAATAYKNGLRELQTLTQVVEKQQVTQTKQECKPLRDLDLQPECSECDYRKKVNAAKEHITAGDVIQTVVAHPFTADAPADPVELYRAQRHVNPSPYLYFVQLGGRCLIGSSPETMVKLDRGTVWTRPIAGTRPRGKTPKEDRLMADELLRDEKERAEHLMLVDLGRNDLGRVAAPGSVRVTDLMFVERYSHVMHLVTNVTCELPPERDAWDLFAAVFPAGTLSGAPKVPAMKLIAELETAPRGFYGGAVGYISFTGDMDLAITIRTACIQDGKLVAYAGAGIVADSDPASEYRETVNKAGSVERALKLVATWEKET